MIAGQTLAGTRELACDVVVVGSGASGAVVAAELAGAGQDVVVLEEGPHVPSETYARYRPSESVRHLWRDGAMTFTVPLGDSPAINVTMGRCVGGSSVLTGGVCFRTPEAVLREWADVRGLRDLSAARMDRCFAAVEREVHVEEVPEAMRSRSTRLFALGAERLGFGLKPLRRNTRGCEGHGRCNFGCPAEAKLSVDRTYLPRAVAAGARVVSDCLVVDLLRHGDRAVGVSARVADAQGKARRLDVHARRVVLAAGAFHTPLLLQRAGVGRASEQVGRNMTLHPAFRVMAHFDDPVRGWDGALQSAWTDRFVDENITLVGLFLPPGVIAATMPGIGAEHARGAARIANVAIFGGLIHDDGGGVVRRGLGREPIATYRMSKRDRAAIPRMWRHMARTFFAAGAREVILPILGLEPRRERDLASLDLERVPASRIECSSQHPLGTCRMGISPEHSVVRPSGEAWDLRELYVVDGSILPTSLGVNPQLTIMAMATRIAWGMRDRALPDRVWPDDAR